MTIACKLLARSQLARGVNSFENNGSLARVILKDPKTFEDDFAKARRVEFDYIKKKAEKHNTTMEVDEVARSKSSISHRGRNRIRILTPNLRLWRSKLRSMVTSSL